MFFWVWQQIGQRNAVVTFHMLVHGRARTLHTTHSASNSSWETESVCLTWCNVNYSIGLWIVFHVSFFFFSFSGAQGEYTGLRAIRAYHEHIGQENRKVGLFHWCFTTWASLYQVCAEGDSLTAKPREQNQLLFFLWYSNFQHMGRVKNNNAPLMEIIWHLGTF